MLILIVQILSRVQSECSSTSTLVALISLLTLYILCVYFSCGSICMFYVGFSQVKLGRCSLGKPAATATLPSLLSNSSHGWHFCRFLSGQCFSAAVVSSNMHMLCLDYLDEKIAQPWACLSSEGTFTLMLEYRASFINCSVILVFQLSGGKRFWKWGRVG